MQKIILSFFVTLLFCSCANAEDNRKMTNEELIAKIMRLNKEQQASKEKTAKIKEKTAKMKEKTAKMKEQTKALEKIVKALQVEK